MKILRTLVLFLITTVAFAQGGLSDEEKALFKRNVVVPVPSEIISALDILSDVNWKEVVEYNYSADYAENYKLALNLGVRVAQGFIAIQAEDRRNTGSMFSVSRDIAENFGAKSEMFVDKDKIAKLLNENGWSQLRSIMDDTHLKIKIEMEKYDPDFVALASIGGWMEGLHIVSTALVNNYKEEASSILYQPELIDYFSRELNSLKQRNRDNKEVSAIISAMPRIKTLSDVGAGNPIPLENIKELHKISSEIKELIVASIKDKGAEEQAGGNTMIFSLAGLAFLILVFLVIKKKGGQ